MSKQKTAVPPPPRELTAEESEIAELAQQCGITRAAAADKLRLMKALADQQDDTATDLE